MKIALKILAFVTLTAAPAGALTADAPSQTPSTFDVPKTISIRVELQDSPELETAGSWWEVSLQIGVEERDAYMRWLAQYNGNPGMAPRPGTVLIKKSFPRRALSKKRGRLVEITVPVGGELLERFRQLKKNPQVIWLSGSIRVHAGQADVDVVNDDINPIWDLRYFIDKPANMKVTLNTGRRLSWSYGNQMKVPSQH